MSNSQEEVDLARIKSINELMSKLFAIGATFLTFIGLFGNLISLLVFIRAKQNAPKIAVRKYLILLTASNAIFLLLAWYIQAAPILHYIMFDSTANSSVIKSFVDNIRENKYTCKAVNYVFGVCKTISILLILSFSIERALVICFPLKAVVYKDRISIVSFRILILIVLISLTLNMHTMYLYELVEFSPDNVHDSNYQATSYECAIDLKNYDKFYYFLISVIVVNMGIPFFIIIMSNVAIVVKLKRTENELLFNELDKRISIETTSSNHFMSSSRRINNNRLSLNNNSECYSSNEQQQKQSKKQHMIMNKAVNHGALAQSNRASNRTDLMRKFRLFTAKSLMNSSLDHTEIEYFSNGKDHEYLCMIGKKMLDEQSEDGHLKLPGGAKKSSSSFDIGLNEAALSASISQKSSQTTLNQATRYSNLSLNKATSNGPRCSFSLNNIANNNSGNSTASNGSGGGARMISNSSIVPDPMSGAGSVNKAIRLAIKKQSTISKKNYQKLYNTKMLIVITTLFVLLNLPYFILSCITLNLSHGTMQTQTSEKMATTKNESSTHHVYQHHTLLDIELAQAVEETSLLWVDKKESKAAKAGANTRSSLKPNMREKDLTQYKYFIFNIYISITELLYLSHYSLFIIFSLASSRIFRLHLKSILNRYYNLK